MNFIVKKKKAKKAIEGEGFRLLWVFGSQRGYWKGREASGMASTPVEVRSCFLVILFALILTLFALKFGYFFLFFWILHIKVLDFGFYL